MSKITASFDLDRVPNQELARYAAMFCEQVARTLNGGLDFSSNFNAKILPITFTAANADHGLKTGLDRVPLGYLVINQNASMIVYDGTTPNSTSFIYLRSSATGTANILVF